MKFEVEKMKCGGCAANVQKAIVQQDASATVQVDLATKQVTVESTLPAATVAQTLTQAGYPARLID